MPSAARSPQLPQSHALAGRYRLIEPLASGGMATVWKAHDERLGRAVAVKFLDAGPLAGSAGARAEAQALAKMSHPHIANVYDYGTIHRAGVPEVSYLVMEFIDGPSLNTILADRGSLPWGAAVSTAAQVADALAAAHARGLVHRDISPANILLPPAGVKIVDFGICATEGQRDADPAGNVLGTPDYLAPERLDGLPVGPAADVYGLGVLLYRMLSGYWPWPAETARELLDAHRNDDPDPLPFIDGLPMIVSDLCLRCLARRPEDRPAAGEAARALLAALDGTAFTALSAFAQPDTSPPAAATRILAWSAPTIADTRRLVRPMTRGRSDGAALAFSVIIVVALLGAVTGWAPGRGITAPQAVHRATGLATPWCDVTYRVNTDNGDHFIATITVADTIPTNLTAVLPQAGDYHGTNPVPIRFWLGDNGCTSTLLVPSVTPIATNVDGRQSHSPPSAGANQGKGKKGKGGKRTIIFTGSDA